MHIVNFTNGSENRQIEIQPSLRSHVVLHARNCTQINVALWLRMFLNFSRFAAVPLQPLEPLVCGHNWQTVHVPTWRHMSHLLECWNLLEWMLQLQLFCFSNKGDGSLDPTVRRQHCYEWALCQTSSTTSRHVQTTPKKNYKICVFGFTLIPCGYPKHRSWVVQPRLAKPTVSWVSWALRRPAGSLQVFIHSVAKTRSGTSTRTNQYFTSGGCFTFCGGLTRTVSEDQPSSAQWPRYLQTFALLIFICDLHATEIIFTECLFISRPNTHELNQTTRSHKRSSSLCKQVPHSRNFATASNNSSCVVSLKYFPSFPAFCCTVTSKKPEQPFYITNHIGFFQLRAHHRKVVKSASQAKSSPWVPMWARQMRKKIVTLPLAPKGNEKTSNRPWLPSGFACKLYKRPPLLDEATRQGLIRRAKQPCTHKTTADWTRRLSLIQYAWSLGRHCWCWTTFESSHVAAMETPWQLSN